MATITVAVAGVTASVQLPGSAWAAALTQRYEAFLSVSPPDWQVDLKHDPAVAVAESPWVRREATGIRFHAQAHTGGLDTAACRAWVSAPSPEEAGPALDHVLLLISGLEQPRRQAGLLLPAAGVMIGGAGHCFCGASGQGKTTLARLARDEGFQVFSDAHVIVQAQPGHESRLLSTPYWGEDTPASLIERRLQQAPLRALYLLEHSPIFVAVRLSIGQAVEALLATAQIRDRLVGSVGAWLAVARRLAAQVPVYRLGFRPSAGLWPFLTSLRP